MTYRRKQTEQDFFCLFLSAEYGLTFPSLLSWLYAVEDDQADLRYLDPASEDVQQTLLGECQPCFVYLIRLHG